MRRGLFNFAVIRYRDSARDITIVKGQKGKCQRHSQWLTAVVKPVSKKTSPTNLSDYRPISVTPIMSIDLQKKILVQQWLRRALLIDLINDQFAFRPTGSTTSALVKFTHHATQMLEENSFVHC